MAKNSNKNEMIINSLIHNIDVTNVLSKLHLRMILSSGSVLIAKDGSPKTYKDIDDTYIKCEIQSPNPGRIDYISADTATFTLMIFPYKLNSNVYTYSIIKFYDKSKKKGYDLRNESLDAPKQSKSPLSLLFKRKK